MKAPSGLFLKSIRLLLPVIIPVAIIGGAILAAKTMISNAPPPPVVERKEEFPRVNIVRVSAVDTPAIVESQGTVETFFRTQLASEVTGPIISISEKFQAGVQVAKGDILLAIEPTNYEVALAQAKANLAAAREQLISENARAAQAKADWERLGSNASSLHYSPYGNLKSKPLMPLSLQAKRLLFKLRKICKEPKLKLLTMPSSNNA